MKILNLNVGLFESNNTKLANFIKEQNPDILAFQEVTRSVDGTAKQEVVSYDTIINATKDLKYTFFAPFSVLDFFEKSNFHGKEAFRFELGGFCEFGNFIKSRYQIIQGKNLPISLNQRYYSTSWADWPERDYVTIQLVDLEISPTQKLRILNYHGLWSKGKLGDKRTLEVCTKIKNLALEADFPALVCGDFNLFPFTDSMKVFDNDFVSLTSKYNIKTTRPDYNEHSDKDINVIDFIFATKDIKINDFEVLDSDVSDHLPSILDFDLN